MDRIEATRQKLSAQLDQWSAEIDRLEAKAREAEAEACLRYMSEVEELRDRKEQAIQRLRELSDAGEQAADDVVAGAEQAWEELGESVKAAARRFG